ncbi:DUF3368 domain-containing protein [Methylorubrum sp. Q1]|uniref:DUF3368 domain-containing protein n=1 Tax=Methylorubrum sp. Q1 TaxID=2562453 RepID=UPI001FDF65E6|nr:DUF3368 domain-containing protein [Methylorubrum sp. Q1]
MTKTGALWTASGSEPALHVVVADTGPLNYLILIEQAAILPALFGTVLIPEAVRHELTQPGAPAPVRAWMATPPAWLTVHPDMGSHTIDLQRFGAGEREAILVALDLHADLVLMDDRAGVAAARAKGLTVVGTLGLIDRAAQRGLLNVMAAVARLRSTNFRCRPEMLDDLLALHQRDAYPV